MAACLLAGSAFATAACSGDAPPLAAVGTLPVEPLPLRVTLSRDSLLAGDTASLVVRDALGAPVHAGGWRSTDARVASVSDDGRVTAHTPGETIVMTTRGTATLALNVFVRAGVAASLEVWPREIVAHPGATRRLAILARAATGHVLPPGTAEVHVADESVATATRDGIIARAPGVTTVTVTVGMLRRTIPVEVRAPATRAFDIDIDIGVALDDAIADPRAAAIRVAFDAAAARWEALLPADLPDAEAPAGDCGGMPGRVDDLRIRVRTAAIDGRGGAVAHARPCAVRAGTALAVTGEIVLDSADVDLLVETGYLQAVAAHEIGHVLGIGTLWHGDAAVIAPRSGYAGAHGRHAAAALGVTREAAIAVPVEWDAAGTHATHWDPTDLTGELMAPAITDRAPSISRVTAAALRDLGYVVDEAAASEYFPVASLPGLAPIPASFARVAPLGIDMSRDVVR